MYEDVFIPRVGDIVWVPDLKDRVVSRVAIIPPWHGAMAPQLMAYLDLADL